MTRVTLEKVRHSYARDPAQDPSWALKMIDLDWTAGGAHALLGPSGCGKTTLLNIISGLIRPTEGRVRFGERDVTTAPPDQRNIAQVFQFPVVYDTMTVYDNLAFPLRNRGMGEREIAARVREIAAMLDLEGLLRERASGLTADGKQKISLGRGLVRADVNAILFDEPLTVIDPHLKWRLRAKLKELHQRVRTTMIYVTHDQTEALTFADEVVVMNDGEVLQAGTPVELFERPRHTFVGHFIGSPGMNILPCGFDGGVPVFAGRRIATAGAITLPPRWSRLELGIRPEFVRIAAHGIPVRVAKISDAGRFRIVEAMHEDLNIKLLLGDGEAAPGEHVHLAFEPAQTHLYADGWITTGAAA